MESLNMPAIPEAYPTRKGFGSSNHTKSKSIRQKEANNLTLGPQFMAESGIVNSSPYLAQIAKPNLLQSPSQPEGGMV